MRRQSGRVSLPSAPPPSFALLPDDALEAILGQLSLTERQSVAVLVCKRWRRACAAPSLLRDVSLAYTPLQERMPLDCWLDSIFSFLSSGAASHMTSLDIAYNHFGVNCQPATHHALTACLAVAGAAGMLERLRISVAASELHCGAWAANLRRLRELSLGAVGGEVTLSTSMRRMTALQCLGLTAVSVSGAHALPTSLTKLIWRVEGFTPPYRTPELAKISSLTSLHMLTLMTCYETWASDVLAAMSSLRSLRTVCSALPRCLPQLTQLQALSLHAPCDVLPAEQQGALFDTLQQLTALWLFRAGVSEHGMAAISRLPSLRKCAVLCNELQPLPGVTWMSSLTWLAVEHQQVLHQPEQQLRGAPQLESLTVVGACHPGQARQWDALFAWARQAAALRHMKVLLVGPLKAQRAQKYVRRGLQELQQARPELHAAMQDYYYLESEFWDEVVV